MKKNKLVGLMILGNFLLFLACARDKKVDKPVTPENKIASLLTSHSWHYSNIFYFKENGKILPFLLNACVLDDTLDFSEDGNYYKNPGRDLCPNQLAKKDTLSWKLVNENKQLEILNKGILVKKDILRLVADSLFTSEVTPLGDTQIFVYLKHW